MTKPGFPQPGDGLCYHPSERMLSPVTPGTVTLQASLAMGFSRQEYWSGLPFPSPGHLPNPRMEPASLALTGGLFN